MDLTDKVLQAVEDLPLLEQKRLRQRFRDYENAVKREGARASFLDYVRAVWPGFIAGHHHTVIAEAFERMSRGETDRLMINMAPRFSKSEMSSIMLPSWWLGLHPEHKIIQASNIADLAKSFGRRVRNLVEDPMYKEIFPRTSLVADAKAAGKWGTAQGGEYFAVGVGGAVAGKGADLLIIDDAHTDQEGAMGLVDPSIFDSVYEWYTTGPRQRLQPGGKICIVGTRWGKRDLYGRIQQEFINNPKGDKWEVITLPAVLPSGRSMWPEFWPVEELLRTKEVIPPSKWAAQYQQEPTSEENAILKRDYWKRWKQNKPPYCDYVLMSWDTAFEKSERADFSACTVWGVFTHESPSDGMTRNCLVLLDAFKDRMEFPKLKQVALDSYHKWKPDTVIIEKKASGAPLIYELQAVGVPVEGYTPVRGTTKNPNNKIARANAVSDIISSGMVWAPETRYADEVITECAEFPTGDYDDYVDSVVMALHRFRQGGFLSLPTDNWDAEPVTARKAAYY
jgi:predicted phage terminase large subunit-like protein